MVISLPSMLYIECLWQIANVYIKRTADYDGMWAEMNADRPIGIGTVPSVRQ